MQSDTSFIPDSYLSIGAHICDVSTWANITELLIECQHPSRKKKILAPPQRGEAEDQIQSACAVLVSMSCYRSQFGLSAFLSPHTRPPLPIPPLSIRHGNSILRQHASQAERHAHPSPACNSVNTGSVHRPFFMAPQVFNLLVPSLSVRSLTSTLWKPCKLSLMELYEYLFPSALPVSLLLHQVCSATVWCSIFRNESEEGWRGGGVEGKGRGRLPEGSALWLALSNWLMRKASLCSWQAGDSSSWLRWYTYLGLKWRWRWWREGLPSHCKGVKKEIRLLHIMPNEIGPPADAHATMSCEHTHTLPSWTEHTVNGMGEGVCGRAEWQTAWMRDEEHMLEVHVFCLSDIRVWKEHSISGSMEDNKKMGEKTKKEKKRAQEAFCSDKWCSTSEAS